MNWPRTILDGVVMCAVFNSVIALAWLSCPGSFSQMLPPEIRKSAPKRTKREIKTLVLTIYPLYLLLIAYAVLSAYFAGVNGFWNLFWTAYIEMMFINLGDFFGLDWLFRSRMKERIMISGTEHCEAWNTKKWMLTLAIPEHWVLWPLLVCPLAGLICAGIGIWIR